MNRTRVVVRLGLLVVIGLIFLIVRHSIVQSFRGTEPIAIDAQSTTATFERAFPNIELDRPVFVTFPPDDTNRIVVLSQSGTVLIFPNDPGVEEAGELLNIRDRIIKEGSSEDGLLGLVFHPKFRENRQFFLYYTNPEHFNILSRFKMSAGDASRADRDLEEEIFRTPQVTGNHNGGTLLFGPDGYLYMAVGDGGPVGDPHRNAQNIQSVLGKILRIDVDHQDAGLKYAIPADNPFVDRKGARAEIWALGLRNVWRMSLDHATDRLWAGDVGEDAWEEIDVIERGGNYGWNIKEGFSEFTQKPDSSPSLPGPFIGKLIDPVFAYNHSVGNCIIGGCVYRGKKVPELFGAYLFADHVRGQLYAMRYDERSGQANSVQPMMPMTMPVCSFGEDESGEVYFTTTQGTINRIVAARPQQ